MFRTARILALSALCLTLVSIGRAADTATSAKVKALTERAKRGDPQAQFELGTRYLHAQSGLKQNVAEALQWLHMSAEQNNKEASYELGFGYEHGLFGPVDGEEAIRWYRKAAEQGYEGASLTIGEMYFDGRAVKQDYAEAANWFGCPKPSETILRSCKETSYEELPQGAVDLLRKMKCDVGSNYDYGSAVDLSGDGTPVYQICCSEPPHGSCSAVVIGKIGEDWKDLTPKEGLLGFDGACNGFIVLDSQHNGFHDVCIPDQCSTVTPVKDTECPPTIWQFSNGRYRSVANTAAKPQQ